MNMRSLAWATLLLAATTLVSAQELADPTRPPSARDTYDGRAGSRGIVRVEPIAAAPDQPEKPLSSCWPQIRRRFMS